MVVGAHCIARRPLELYEEVGICRTPFSYNFRITPSKSVLRNLRLSLNTATTSNCERRLGMSDLKPTVIGLGILMPLLATLAVCLRIHSRRIKKNALGVDDYLALAALVCTISIKTMLSLDFNQMFSIALSIVTLAGMLLCSSLSYISIKITLPQPSSLGILAVIYHLNLMAFQPILNNSRCSLRFVCIFLVLRGGIC